MNLKKLKTNKYVLTILSFVLIGVFAYGGAAKAGWLNVAFHPIKTTVVMVVGGVVQIFVIVFGTILGLAIKGIVEISQYNNFAYEDSIIQAWVIIRDLSNMFFVLVLLIIAFATILRLENYSMKRWLPKLIIMAILINFSRSIVSILIFIAQIVMLTFVSAIGDSGSSFIVHLGVQDYLLYVAEKNWTTDIDLTSTVVGLLSGAVFLVVSAVVMLVLLGVLVMRIVFLWVYIVLSPLAFLLSAFPGGQGYASKYWKDLTKQIVIGPVLAFFIWLSLVATQGVKQLGNVTASNTGGTVGASCFGDSKILCPDQFLHFIIGIGMLMGGLTIASMVGGAAGSMAGLGLGKIKAGGRLATKAGKESIFWGGRHLDNAQSRLQGGLMRAVGKENYVPKSLNYRMIQEGYKKNRADAMAKYEFGKAGAWQDKFDRFHHGSARVPFRGMFPSKAKEEAEKIQEKIDDDKSELASKRSKIEKLDSDLANPALSVGLKAGIQKEKSGIESEAKALETNIAKSEARKAKKIKESRRIGGLPPEEKQYKLEQKRKISEERSKIDKEELSEEGLVYSFMDEQRYEKKRAYFQQLVDINGLNSLLPALGKTMDFHGILEMLTEQFGDDAAEVAADMSKRADAKGNVKLIGFGSFNPATGKYELVEDNARGEELQISRGMTKASERYDQEYVRKTHVDSIVDRDAKGNISGLSNAGLEHLLLIASSPGKMAEIQKGNYQRRFAQAILDLEKSIKDQANALRASGRAEDADKIINVYNEFDSKYNKKIKPKEGGAASEDDD